MISVLMAVYAGDRAPWLAAALASLQDQTTPAQQVVVVEDGPIEPAVAGVLEDFAGRLPLTRVALPTNQGLAAALQAGLERCEFDLVARADADDICTPGRLGRQLEVMSAQPDLSALGGLVAEFDEDPEHPYAVRPVATGRATVARRARWRCPLNHPTVMFRRADVLAVGGYSGYVGIEDYHLWGKLLAGGYHLDNLAEVLVLQRAGAALGRRRGGWRYAKTEVGLLRGLVDLGFLSRGQAVVGGLLRVPVRLVPSALRVLLYNRALRRRLEG